MAIILAQRVTMTVGNGKITRAMLQRQEGKGTPRDGNYKVTWVDVKELEVTISEDGKAVVTFPAPGEKME